jgi:hypothetical protein
MFVAALALLINQCLFRSVKTDKSHTSLWHWDNSTRPDRDSEVFRYRSLGHPS